MKNLNYLIINTSLFIMIITTLTLLLRSINIQEKILLSTKRLKAFLFFLKIKKIIQKDSSLSKIIFEDFSRKEFFFLKITYSTKKNCYLLKIFSKKKVVFKGQIPLKSQQVNFLEKELLN